ncbi:DMT family transporter [Kineococcus rhizosphaerae]|uniref:Drug/metabolite transporter (DMT)-like permease n=1 Tax=Kineococcus rhizosphaerae TaxID=559628 RepID=A0A2T0QXL2_9ACTN|nr:drug/metabolite transporter (DMT)-like permease [Kineococcus rhizosphaerae]
MRHVLPRPIRPTRQEAALVAVTAVWGGTFLTVKHGLSVAGPMSFVALRFGAAALLLALVSGRALKGVTRRELLVGAAVGVALFGGYGLQTAGLRTIPSATSAFLTALYVPLVPVLQWLLLRRRPSAGNWVAVGLALTGLVLLTGLGLDGLTVGTGELLTLAGAVASAAEILLIGRFAAAVDARRVTVVQLATCAALAGLTRPLVAEPVPGFSWTLAVVVAAMAVSTAVIQSTMNWAQRSVSPTRATVIYAGEPVWAGLVGRVAGERLGPAAVVGGGLVVLAALVSELRFRRSPEPLQLPAPRPAAADGPRAQAVAGEESDPEDAVPGGGPVPGGGDRWGDADALH